MKWALDPRQPRKARPTNISTTQSNHQAPEEPETNE